MSRYISTCQIVDSLSTGGAERLVALQAVQLHAAGQQVHVVSLASPCDGAVTDVLREGGVPITHVPATGSHGLLDRERLRALTQVVADIAPGLIHVHLETSTVLGASVARKLNLPSVATLHGSEPDFNRLGFVKRRLLYRALQSIDSIVVVGPRAEEMWRSAVPGLETTVVLNPVSALGPVPARSVRNRSDLTILAVGRLVHQKSYEVLVEAMRSVVDAEPTVRCRIAGEGPERASIEAAIERFDVGGHVEMLGSRSDISQLLADADLFVSSSSSEGLPVSVLEALAAALPVVCTDVGDVPSAVPPEAGIIVAPQSPQKLADALVAMIRDPERRRRSGAAGRDHVEQNHDPTRWAQRIADIYGETTLEGATSTQVSLSQ